MRADNSMGRGNVYLLLAMRNDELIIILRAQTIIMKGGGDGLFNLDDR